MHPPAAGANSNVRSRADVLRHIASSDARLHANCIVLCRPQALRGVTLSTGGLLPYGYPSASDLHTSSNEGTKWCDSWQISAFDSRLRGCSGRPAHVSTRALPALHCRCLAFACTPALPLPSPNTIKALHPFSAMLLHHFRRQHSIGAFYVPAVLMKRTSPPQRKAPHPATAATVTAATTTRPTPTAATATVRATAPAATATARMATAPAGACHHASLPVHSQRR